MTTTGCFFFSDEAAEIQCLSPSSLHAEVCNTCSYTPLPPAPPYVFMFWLFVENKHKYTSARGYFHLCKAAAALSSHSPLQIAQIKNACCYAVSRNLSGTQPQVGDNVFCPYNNKQSLCLCQFLFTDVTSVPSYHLNSFPKILTYQPAIIKLLGADTLYSLVRFIWCSPPSYFRYLRAECCKINQQLNYLARVTGLNKT